MEIAIQAVVGVIAVAALWVSIKTRADAKSAPLNAAQREVRGQVREHAEVLIEALSAANASIEHGTDLGPTPDEVATSRAALALLAPRLASGSQPVQLAYVLVQTAELHWSSIAHDEHSRVTVEERIVSAVSHVREMAEFGPKATQEAEDRVDRVRAELAELDRARPDRRLSARNSIASALTALKDLVKRLNAADLQP